MIKDIIILGGKGDGLGVASIIETLIDQKEEKLNILGFLNDGSEETVYGYPVLGKLKETQSFLKHDNTFFISAILKVKQSYARSSLIESLKIPLSRFLTIIHPSATIARSAKIGLGSVISPHVNIMPNVTIGNHCSIRASANIGHDCVLENYCYMGPNSTIAGGSTMKIGSHLGPNSCMLEFKTMGPYSVAGICSSVIKDVNEFEVVFGCPARKIGKAYKKSIQWTEHSRP